MIKQIILFLVIANLFGCAYLKSKKDDNNKNTEVVEWQSQKLDCKQQNIEAKNCPTLSYNGVLFKREIKLNELVEERFLSLLEAGSNVSSLLHYQQAYLRAAAAGDSLQLTLTKLEENSAIIVLELKVQETLSSNEYSPLKATYFNFDRTQKRELQLAHILLSDKQLAFERKVEEAYGGWLEVNQLLNNEVYQADWPFVQTQNIALRERNLALQYSPNTLAPYAMGAPVLRIPYNQLKGIIRDKYIPD